MSLELSWNSNVDLQLYFTVYKKYLLLINKHNYTGET